MDDKNKKLLEDIEKEFKNMTPYELKKHLSELGFFDNTTTLVVGYDCELDYKSSIQNIEILDYIKLGKVLLKDTRKQYEDSSYGSKYGGEVKYKRVEDSLERAWITFHFIPNEVIEYMLGEAYEIIKDRKYNEDFVIEQNLK